MGDNRLAWATLICCVLLIVEVAWGSLQVRDLAREWQTVNQPRKPTMVPTLTTRDVVQTSTGLKADIVTPKLDGDTDASWIARHVTSVNAWKNWTAG